MALIGQYTVIIVCNHGAQVQSLIVNLLKFVQGLLFASDEGVYTWTWNKNSTLWKNFIKWPLRQWLQTILKWKSRVNRLKWVKPSRALDQTSAGHRPQFARTARAGTILFCGGLLLVTSTLNPLITMNRKMKFWVNEGFQVIKVNWIGVSPRSTCWLIQFRLKSVTHAPPSLIKI